MKSRIVLFAFCVALLSSCGNKGNGTGKVPEYAVQELQKTTAHLTTAYPATIKGKQDVEIRPQVSGFITKLCVDEGATVRKGQVLFIVDPTKYEAAVRTAKAAVATAEAAVSTQQMTVDNKRELNKKNIISDYDLSMAENTLAQSQAQLAQAKAQLTTAQQNLSFTQVKSPSDGVINDIPYRLGALVSPSISTPMTTVSEIDEVYVYFSMTEKELLAMTKTGGTIKEEISKIPAIKLQLIDGTEYSIEGKVDAITGVIDQSTGSVSMRALFPNKEHIVIRAHKHYIFKLIDTKPLHRSYEVVKPFGVYEDGEYAEFSVDVEMNNEFIGRVLQMGAGLEVMSPPKIRMIFATRVKDMVSYYLEHEEKLQRMVPNSEEPIGT